MILENAPMAVRSHQVTQIEPFDVFLSGIMLTVPERKMLIKGNDF